MLKIKTKRRNLAYIIKNYLFLCATIIVAVLLLSCGKEQNYENIPTVTIEGLAGEWSARLQGSYLIKEFDEEKCWSNQKFDESFSITDNINKEITIKFTASGILVLTDKAARTTYIDDKGTIGTVLEDRITKYFVEFSDAPNNLNVEEYGLPWHIDQTSNDKYVLYRPFYDVSGGHSLYIYNLRKL